MEKYKIINELGLRYSTKEVIYWLDQGNINLLKDFSKIEGQTIEYTAKFETPAGDLPINYQKYPYSNFLYAYYKPTGNSSFEELGKFWDIKEFLTEVFVMVNIDNMYKNIDFEIIEELEELNYSELYTKELYEYAKENL